MATSGDYTSLNIVYVVFVCAMSCCGVCMLCFVSLCMWCGGLCAFTCLHLEPS